MPHASLTRRYRFAASHRLHSPALSPEANRRTYGRCNNPYGHGHDYILDVTIEGPVDGATGRIIALPLLDELVRRSVLDAMDKRDLNTEVAEFTELVPTTESVVLVAASRISRAWQASLASHPARVSKIRIFETQNNICELSIGPAGEDTTAGAAGRKEVVAL